MKKNKVEKPINTAFEDLSKAIKSRRNELGLTQQQLAEYAGCGVVFVYDIEKGKPSVRFDKLVDVLTVIGLKLQVQRGKPGLDVARELQK